ncbi:MAG: nicotinate-nicotinamide nucleotide adenylyltransferase [Desulfuromonas sp.]|nr:MAG: nicotinate-nicotinamide nucleotide adenylyltransferase [Desulfuromonas sp.]
MRIGIFGGTFNPIHFGHLRMAEEVRETCALDRILFMPTATPPHKKLAGDVPFAQRLAMVREAIAGNPTFAVTDLEGRREGKSFSVHTLEILHREEPGIEPFFIMGMDSFCDIETWREYRRLFSLAHLVVLRRPGVEAPPADNPLPVAMQGEFCYDHAAVAYRHVSGYKVFFLCETYLDISSTQIRQLIACERSARYLLPPVVEAYIDRHGLYRAGKGSSERAR